MLDVKNWHEVTESQFLHEKEGLASLRQACDPATVLKAFTNFEFLDDQGKLYEVDALLLTVYGLTLLELKHYRGQVVVDELNWVRRTHPNSASYSEKSPLSGANLKCKVLAGLVRRHLPSVYGGPRLSVEPVVYLSHPDVQLRFAQPARFQPICDNDSLTKMVNAAQGAYQRDPLPRPFLSQVLAALEKLGIRQNRRRELRVGEYLIQELLGEGPNYQDHRAVHSELGSVEVRVRTFVGKDPLERERARRTANREFTLLRELRHDHILSPEGYKEWELGPALLYPFYPKASRLDLALATAESSQKLGFADRLRLWGQVGEALRYAHQRHIYHRTLAPQTVLVLWNDPPDAKVINWQTLSAEERTSGTVHLAEWVEERATAYLAPEMLTAPNEADHSVDLFSLGCLGYFLFTGQDPASNQSELQEKLLQQEGLNLLAVLDQAPPKLVQLIRDLTHPVHYFRPESANAFLQRLAEVETEWRHQDEAQDDCHDPFTAQPGDLVLPGHQLLRRLGQGSSSVAFLVRNGEGEELVLKVPLPSQTDERLVQESEVLQKLSHRKIVELRAVTQVGVKKALLLSSAGPETLAERLGRDGVLGLELLQRFGDDLLELAEHLEHVGMAHRDIKPANLGVRPLGKNQDLHLVLFDFSLAREDRRKVEAGTPGYRDPFLHTSQRPWDEAAERYAVAVTLYEMATGRLPQWGDGRVNPATAPIEVQFPSGDFEPSLRERFEEFFKKAFQRQAQQRFESANVMRSAWRELFANAQLDESPSAIAIPERVPGETALSSLTHNPQLLQVFDRLRLTTASALMGVPRSTLLRLSNVGGLTRQQLRDLYDLLKERLVGAPQPYQHVPEQALETLLQTLLPAKPEEARLVELYLCGTAEQEWPLPLEAARLASTPPKVDANKVTLRARQQWGRHPELEGLGHDLDQAITEMGGGATVDELCDTLLSLRGAMETRREPRRRLARGVLRALLERECMQSLPRFDLVRLGRQPLVCADLGQAERLWQAAQRADELVTQEPLPSLSRTLQELSQLVQSEQALTEGRLLRLIVALAQRARLSSRGELYPVGMPPNQSLRLVSGLLAGRELTLVQLQELVQTRYPEAASLPAEEPAIDALFAELNLMMRWDDSKHRFRSTLATSHSGRSRSSLGAVTGMPFTEAEARLRDALRGGEPQVIKVRSHELVQAEEWLRQTFEIPTVSLEDRLVEQLLSMASAEQIDEADLWAADQLGADSPEDWQGLKELAREAAGQVVAQLEPVAALKRFSLWSRFGLLDLVQNMIDRAGRPGGPQTLWLLAPYSEGLPTIDNQPLPMPPATRPLEWSAAGWLK
jgi:serine/threonine protein kinase